MTKNEAREIYDLAVAISNDEKELRKLCASKSVPDAWISEFMEEDEDQERLDEDLYRD